MIGEKTMRFPVFLALFTVFSAWLSYELKKNSHTDTSFWKRENEANNVRKQSLDKLDYITIPLDSLPLFSGIDEKLDEVQKSIIELASCTIVNLSSYTNTDLKFMYGAGNLPALTEYDQNFTLLVRTLHRWSEQLIALGYENEAVQVLEYAVSIKSEVTADYIALAKLYQKQHTPDKIDALLEAASALSTLLKDSLLCRLKAVRDEG